MADEETVPLMELFRGKMPQDLRREDAQVQQNYAKLYYRIITSPSLREASRVLGESMKRNLFVNLHDIPSYYKFDNPSSKKYLSQLQKLGMLTTDSDVFDYDASAGNEYARYVMQRDDIGLTPELYSNMNVTTSQTQFGYVDGLIPSRWAQSIDRVKSMLPPLTTIIRLQANGTITKITRREGDSQSDFVVPLQVTNVHLQKGAPSIFSALTGTTSRWTLASHHGQTVERVSQSIPQRLANELRNYDLIILVDNDFNAQRRDKHRAFKTLRGVLKRISGE